MRSKQNILAIQALRGFAALAVVLGHAYDNTTLRIEFSYPPPQVGVDIFFAISGFVMLYAHRDAFGSVRNARNFLLRRAFRIGPIYWILTLTSVALGLIALASLENATALSLSWILGSLFFIPISSPDGSVVPIVGVGWTLNYEAAFYVIFSIGMVLPFRLGIPIILVIICAILPVYPMAIEFTFGMAVAAIFQSRPALLDRYRVLLWLVALCIIPAMLIVPSSHDILRAFAWGIPSAAIIGICVTSRWSFGKSAQLIGSASYSIYLIQVFTLPASYSLTEMANLNSPVLSITLSLMLTTLCGVAFWRLVEKPIAQRLAQVTLEPGFTVSLQSSVNAPATCSLPR